MEKEIVKEEIFFSFNSNQEIYEIVIPPEDGIYGTILNIPDEQEEILNIQSWAKRFLKILGYEKEIEELHCNYEKEDEYILFTGSFGILEISKGCNLVYERSTT